MLYHEFCPLLDPFISLKWLDRDDRSFADLSMSYSIVIESWLKLSSKFRAHNLGIFLGRTSYTPNPLEASDVHEAWHRKSVLSTKSVAPNFEL